MNLGDRLREQMNQRWMKILADHQLSGGRHHGDVRPRQVARQIDRAGRQAHRRKKGQRMAKGGGPGEVHQDQIAIGGQLRQERADAGADEKGRVHTAGHELGSRFAAADLDQIRIARPDAAGRQELPRHDLRPASGLTDGYALAREFRQPPGPAGLAREHPHGFKKQTAEIPQMGERRHAADAALDQRGIDMGRRIGQQRQIRRRAFGRDQVDRDSFLGQDLAIAFADSGIDAARQTGRQCQETGGSGAMYCTAT